jgi:hypothetical protein
LRASFGSDAAMRSANHLVARILGDRDVNQLIYSDALPDPTWTSTPPEPLSPERGTRIDASGKGGTLSLARRDLLG